MTQFLPSNLLALFAPREPLKYLPPVEKLPHEKNLPPYSGIAGFLGHFEAAKDVPPPTRVETKEERKERQKKEKLEMVAYKLEQDLAMWDPVNDPAVKGDPYKTLFCARINYDTSESKLRREFDVYGPIKRLRMVVNKDSGKPRGYAFIEFEHERDMHAAYKHADGKKIDGRRILVDVERGRTVKGWRPRRLAGGLGSTRRGGSEVNTRVSGREESRDMIDFERRADMERRRTRSKSNDRDRYRERERERDRDTRRRSRSRERERRRRSRERRRSAERDLVKKEPQDEINIKSEPGLEDDKEQVKRAVGGTSRRSRSRDRDRRRSRSPRGDKKRRRSRSRDRERERRDRRRNNGAADQQQDEQPYIKQERNEDEYEESGDQQYGTRLEDM